MVAGISEERQEQSIKAGKRVKRQADINPKWEKQSRVKTQWSNRERWERSEMSAGAIQDFAMSVCECGLSSPIDEHQVN